MPLSPEKDRLRQKSFKGKCRRKLRDAVKAKKIKRPIKCEACNSKSLIEAHHFDYSKPFDVQWLCHKCHVGKHYNLAV